MGRMAKVKASPIAVAADAKLGAGSLPDARQPFGLDPCALDQVGEHLHVADLGPVEQVAELSGDLASRRRLAALLRVRLAAASPAGAVKDV